MRNFLFIADTIIGIILTVAILLQQRGTGLGGTFGGDSAIYRSKRGAEKFLFISTIVLAIVFFGLAVAQLLVS